MATRNDPIIMESLEIIKTPMADCYLKEGILYNVLMDSAITLEIAKGHIAALRAHFGGLTNYPSSALRRICAVWTKRHAII